MKHTPLAIAAALASALITLPAWAEEQRPTGLPKPGIIVIPPAQTAPDMRQQQSTVNNLRTGSNTLKAETTLSVNTVHQAQERDPVSSAFAPSINPTANCVVPVTGGAQGASFGFAIGSAFESDTCDTIEQAKTAMHTFGDHSTGEEIMCGLAKYRAARRAINRPCLADQPGAPGATLTETCLDPSGNPYADPLVAARACPAK